MWFYLCRPVSIEEVWSAAFKHSNRQMFQFPTWRTGSADVKGTKCLFGIVTTLWFLLPPPTLNLLPWSWTVWIRTVKAALWSGSWEPLTCKMEGWSLCSQTLGFPPLLFLSRLWKFWCTVQRSSDNLSALSREKRPRCVGFFCLVLF